MPKKKQQKKKKAPRKQAKPRIRRQPRPVDSALVRIKAVQELEALGATLAGGSKVVIPIHNRMMGTGDYSDSPLHALSNLFQQVRIHKLSFRFISTLPATAGGRVAAGLDRDGTATAYTASTTGYNYLVKLSGAKDAHAVSTVTIPYPKETYNSNFISCDLNVATPRTFNPFNAENVIAIVLSSAGAGVVPGMLEFDGIFEFKGVRASGI